MHLCGYMARKGLGDRVLAWGGAVPLLLLVWGGKLHVGQFAD